MKNKIISILLVLIMLFSLVSCALPPADNGTGSTGTTTGSTPTTGTGGTGTTPTPPVTPSYYPDKTKYEAIVTPDGKNIYYTNNYKLIAPEFKGYYHGYKAALSMTFDDGYTVSTGQIVSDEYEKYGGFRGTAMLWVSCLSDNAYTQWNNAFARGYMDAGCHSWNHKEPIGLSSSEYEHEIKDAIEHLRLKFPTQRVLTYATPLAHIDNSYKEYLDDLVISNRLVGDGRNDIFSDKFSIYHISAQSVNNQTPITTVKGNIEAAVNNGEWMVELLHGVTESGGDGIDFAANSFRLHMNYLFDKYRDTVWFGSFEDVSIYAMQVKHASIKYVSCDKEGMSYTIECDLDESIYNIPMSFRAYVPNFTDSAYATVNGVYQPLTIERDKTNGAYFVTVIDVPVNDADVKVYIGSNKQFRNGCGHIYVDNEVVASDHDNFGYTERICTKCEHTYRMKFTKPECDFSGEVETICEATTAEMVAYSRVYCTHCDKYKVVKTYTLE